MSCQISYVIVVSSFLRHGVISITFSGVAKDELSMLSKFKLRIKREGWQKEAILQRVVENFRYAGNLTSAKFAFILNSLVQQKYWDNAL